MPSPPSTHPSHAYPLSAPDRLTSQRTSLSQWMAHHHLPFSALTISDPPTPSARELVLVTAVVGRGMFGSARLEIVVPRAEVRRVERESGWTGEDKADETGVEVREVLPASARGGGGEDSAAREEGPVVGLGWGGTQMRRESGSSGDEGTGWSGGDDGGIIVEAHAPLPIFRRAVPPTVNVHHHHHHHPQHQPARRYPHSTALPSSSGGVLSVHCGTQALKATTSTSTPRRPSSPTYMLPNPAFPQVRPQTPTASNCSGRNVLELPLHPAKNTAHAPQQADFAFGPGTTSGRKHARGWILDARDMEGHAGEGVYSATAEDDDGWGKVVCGCARGGGLKVVGCYGCGSPLGILIPNPCPTHALRSPSPGTPHAGPTPIWFIPHQLVDVHYPPASHHRSAEPEVKRMVGR